MIAAHEIHELAHIAALNVTTAPRGLDVLSRLEKLVTDAYQRGYEDGTVDAMSARVQRDFEEILGKRA
jgi:hypothetical protein